MDTTSPATLKGLPNDIKFDIHPYINACRTISTALTHIQDTIDNNKKLFYDYGHTDTIPIDVYERLLSTYQDIQYQLDAIPIHTLRQSLYRPI